MLLLMICILACREGEITLSLIDEEGTKNCLQLKSIIEKNNIQQIAIIRPLGYSYDTTYYDLGEIIDLYGERLFTLGNEKFKCRHIDSIVTVSDQLATVIYNQAGYDNTGPFDQEYVSNYWKMEMHTCSTKNSPI